MDLTVKPPKQLKKYKTKQPPYAHMEGWLPCRCLLTNPSEGGKGIIVLDLGVVVGFTFFALQRMRTTPGET